MDMVVNLEFYFALWPVLLPHELLKTAGVVELNDLRHFTFPI